MKLKGNYEKKDNEIVFNFELENISKESIGLTFPSGQQYEIYIINEAGEEVYRYSENQFFTMAMTMKQLASGEGLSWKQVWNYSNKEGQKLKEGNYKVYIELRAMADHSQVRESNGDRSDLKMMIEFSL